MHKTLLLIISLTLSAFAHAEQSGYYYLTDELNTEAKDCPNHDIPPEHEQDAELAYALSICATYSKLNGDFYTGNVLEMATEIVVNRIPCECNIHNHLDILMYTTFQEVSLLLETNSMPEAMVSFCEELVVRDVPIEE